VKLGSTESVYNSNFLGGTPALNRDDLLHYLKNQEFYYITKHLPDLKYLGAPLITHQGPFGIGFIAQNDYWIRFLKELRLYLNHPAPNRPDWIRHHIEEQDIPPTSIRYLNQLFT
jgi:uncharacterized protein (DUF1919 family)